MGVARERITLAQARRTALAAQGFGGRPSGPVTMRQVQRLVDRVGVLQIDSVNVLSRSHYLPAFSRLGGYDRGLLDRAASKPPRRLVEYWAHEASFVPPETHRLLRWRMQRARDEAWGGMREVAAQKELLQQVLDVVAGHGPVTAKQLEAHLGHEKPRDRSNWGWNWSDAKRAVGYLFWDGQISSAGRTTQFERRYDLPERVLPPAVSQAPDPTPADARRELVAVSAAAMGVATEPDLRDYFRLKPEESRAAIAELVEAGRLTPVEVAGWSRPAYLSASATFPRRVTGRALLSPFDNLIWFRPRTEALWDFRFRLEIYTPEEKRVHGYYVLPFLVDDRLVARVDLKADRFVGDGVLRVRAAHAEAWVEPAGETPRVAAELAAELRDLADWLGLPDVAVEPFGDLAPALAHAVRG
ncbi:winged helix-turn-helix domain-containing protein [Spongisporangium articulatum]|uniref:Winged helix-turn-helix domain-containing protein n=1 Tax=Spongisporangium articulatum TaxID=3362603 RepID=A0ABW8AJW5_9ACTN